SKGMLASSGRLEANDHFIGPGQAEVSAGQPLDGFRIALERIDRGPPLAAKALLFGDSGVGCKQFLAIVLVRPDERKVLEKREEQERNQQKEQNHFGKLVPENAHVHRRRM